MEQDGRSILARLIAMLRGGSGGGGDSAFPPAPGEFPPAPSGAFPAAPPAGPTDMSMAGPWGAGFPPAPTPTPRPDNGAPAVPVPQQRPPQRPLNRGQY